MLYFILGTAISADSLVDVGSCEGAMKIIRELKEDLPLSKLKDDKKLKTRLDDAEQIILRDMEACLIRKSLDTFFAITKVMSYDKKCSEEL